MPRSWSRRRPPRPARRLAPPERLETRRLLAADLLEENDSFEDAADLGGGSQVHTGLTIDTPGDDDFYLWTASPASSGTLDVEIQFEHDAGDVDLEIYDSGHNLLGISESVADREHLRLTVAPSSSYYIRVFGGPQVTQPDYTLALREVVPDPLEPNDTPAQAYDLGSTEPLLQGLTLHVPTDVDLFRFTAPHDGLFQATALFTHDLGDVDLSLYAEDQGALGELLDTSETSDDSEYVSADLQTGDTVLVRVFGADESISPAYDLDIVFGAPPSLGIVPPQTTHMNTAITIPLEVSDVDTPIESLIFSGETSKPEIVPAENIHFDTSQSPPVVTIQPLQGQSGSVNISLTVSDGDTGSANTSFFLLVVPFDPVSPKVSAVRMGSSKWTASYREAVDPQLHLGYAVGSGAGQLDSLAWVNLDQIHLTFNEDVVVDGDDLSVFGVNVASYNPVGFSYDPATFTASWTLADPVGADKLLLSLADEVTDVAGNVLDGEWTDGSQAFPSGDGQPGGDFRFRINVLPGDVIKDALNSVVVNDVVRIRQNQFTQSVFHDLDGNGLVLVNDVVVARQRQFSRLPSGEPVVPPPPPEPQMAQASRESTSIAPTSLDAQPADLVVRDAALAAWFAEGLHRSRRR